MNNIINLNKITKIKINKSNNENNNLKKIKSNKLIDNVHKLNINITNKKEKKNKTIHKNNNVNLNTLSIEKKIDFVITHVDSTNIEWQELYENYKNEKNPTLKSKTKNRFRNNDELKYCLRAIDKYTNFYRYIFIVLNHSPPSWLNIEHPQIKIIHHNQIDDLKDNLPTFNSQAIECNLHKIPDITDEFLYFNDDFFINSNIDYNFFKINNKVNVYIDNYLSPKGEPKKNMSGFFNAWMNSNKILDNYYKKEKRYTIEHCPYFIDKYIVKILENNFKEHFENTTKSKFRELNNINPLCSLIQYHYLYKDIGQIKKSKNCKTIFLKDDYEENKKRIKLLTNTNIKIFCIEDNMLEDKKENIQLIKNFLSKKYPNKSQFEL